MKLLLRNIIHTLSAALILAGCNTNDNNSTINIIPEPEVIDNTQSSKIFTFNENVTYFCPDTTWNYIMDDFSNILKRASGIAIKKAGDKEKNKSSITISKNAELENEAYNLSVSESQISIEASTEKGLFYAIQTIRQLLPAEIESKGTVKNINWSIPCITIKDSPRFEYRGLMLDVSRYFLEKDEVLKIIDAASALKINKLHMHLVDDQGWRIEIKKYPKLTEIGAWKVYRKEPFPLRQNPTGPGEETPVGGYYTQEDIKEIIRYAERHQMEVIPEIEMPAHTNSSLAAYPEYACPTVNHYTAVLPGMGGINYNTEYCVGNEKTYEFLNNILDEVIQLFPSQYIHLGGDEANKKAWETCPKCQKLMKKEGISNVEDLQGYFMDRMAKYVQSKGKKVIGWDELTNSRIPDDVIIFGWRGDGNAGYKAGLKGHNFVLTPAKVLYLIRYQGPQWFEPRTYFGNITLKDVYEYEPVKSDWDQTAAEKLMGIQASLWSEFIESPQNAEYMLFPRLAAMADVAWRQKGNHDWNSFVKGIDNMLSRWDYMNINYAKSMFNLDHKSVPADNKLKLSLSCIRPDVEIRYTTDGTEPTSQSEIYSDTLTINQSTTIKAATFKDGKKKGETLVLPISWNKATGKKVIDNTNKDVTLLTNGIKGSDKHSDFEWCGWYDQNTEFTLDLEEAVTVNKIELGHVVNYGMGVHYPKSIKLYVSDDNKNFKFVKELKYSEKEIYAFGIYTDKLVFDNLSINGRFVKFEIESPGKAPDYHARTGQGVWIYFDEIEVF